MPDGIQQYVKLENRLVLLAWINHLFSFERNRDLLESARSVAEGFGADGHSFLYHHLIALGSQVKIRAADLARYDENIRLHLETINRGRRDRIILRYFQYLAVLYTEIFLDRLFNAKAKFLSDLNAFVRRRNAAKMPGEPQEEIFTESDLTKLAFWMGDRQWQDSSPALELLSVFVLQQKIAGQHSAHHPQLRIPVMLSSYSIRSCPPVPGMLSTPSERSDAGC